MATTYLFMESQKPCEILSQFLFLNLAFSVSLEVLSAACHLDVFRNTIFCVRLSDHPELNLSAL
jgi:hypothetical protein